MDIWGIVREIYGWFMNLLDWEIIGDLCLFYIAVYTFRLTIYPKRLKFVNFKFSTGMFDGQRFEITLENRSLCPVVIQAVDLVVDSNRINVFKGECIVEGFKTAKIEMDCYSDIIADEHSINLDICDVAKMSLWIRTTRGKQKVKYERVSWMSRWSTRRKESKFNSATVCRNYYNEKLVVPGICYALWYIDESDDVHTVFIHKSGAMSETMWGFNSIPQELIGDEVKLIEFFADRFCSVGYRYGVERIESDLRSLFSSDNT